ncbi:MAG: coenzyme F420-0:L-glutamate ligase [Dehalococcoidia bacterium]|nr:coenzyme F420-0:L-glutamate ligase [Dehalococcoidia bacterium]
MPKEIRVIAVEGLPEFKPGIDLAPLVLRAAQAQGTPLEEGDIVVVTQKVVSKIEGNLVDLSTVTPSPLAELWAKTYDRDPRVIEVALGESRRISRMANGVIITETKHGFYCVNAGVDASNVAGTMVALLPKDSDASADRIRDGIHKAAGLQVAVVITDTWGRPWRDGVTNVAIGSSGITVLLDYRGMVDPYGYELSATVIAVVDELAAAAELVMGKLDMVPVAIVKGYQYKPSNTAKVRDMIRPPEMDIYR